MAEENKISNLFIQSEEIDPKSMDYLVNALESNNQKDFDYLEFKQSLVAMAAFNMENELAMKSAFATGTTVGLTKESLLQSADFYKSILQKEKAMFDAALKKQNDQRVESRKNDQDKLTQQITRNKDLINKLQAEINENQKNIDNIDKEIADNIGKIEQTRYKFEHTFAEVINQINQDITNITKLI